MVKIKIYILLLCFSIGCSTFQWKQTSYESPLLPRVFIKDQSLGSGIKYSDSGFHSMPCLESFEKEISGGVLEIEFERVKSEAPSKNNEIKHFVRSNLNRVERFNLGKEKPASFVLVVKIRDRLASVKEETIKFRPDIESVIASGNRETFFRNCGTEYIRTTRFDSKFYFYFSYYPESEGGAEALEKEIKKKLTQYKENVFQLSIFRDLELNSETYFSLWINSDVLVEPIEFSFSKIHGKELDLFLNKLVHALLSSERGEIKNYQLASWSKLDILRGRETLSGSRLVTEYSDEQVFKSLIQLENSIRQYRTRLIQVRQLHNPEDGDSESNELNQCAALLESEDQKINWESYSECKKNAIGFRIVDLPSIAACSKITNAITRLNLSNLCNGVADADSDRDIHLSDKTFKPVVLADKIIDDRSSIVRKDTDYRFTDDEQRDNIPPALTLGQGMDYEGKIYPETCVVEKSRQFGGEKKRRDLSITNDYYPFEKKDWALIKKIMLFWKDSPHWTLYRGSLEIEGVSKNLLPTFEITGQARTLAEQNLTDFYKLCGTHYVEKYKHRRGFIYYFSPDPGGEYDIDIKPFGMTKPKADSLIPEEIASKIPFIGDQERNCRFGLTGVLGLPMVADDNTQFLSGAAVSMACEDNVHPLLDPKSVQEFFANKEKLIQLFKDDANAIPTDIGLRPWSEYLVNKGIVSPEQIDFIESVN